MALSPGRSSTSESSLDISVTMDEDWSPPNSPPRIQWEASLPRFLPRDAEVESTEDLYARSLDGAELGWRESNRYLRRETNDLDKGDPSGKWAPASHSVISH